MTLPPRRTAPVITPRGVPTMRRWILRTLSALLVGVALPAAAGAADPPPANPMTPPPPAGVPAPAPAPIPAAPAAAPIPGTPVYVVPNGAVYLDPYHAATPYNPTTV